jgi:hypothetical protein
MFGVVAIFVAAAVFLLVVLTLCCALSAMVFFTLHLQRPDEREFLWQRLSARQAMRDFQQREHEEGRGPAPLEPDLTPGERVELTSLNNWVMAHEARSQPGPPEDEAAAARREAEARLRRL